MSKTEESENDVSESHSTQLNSFSSSVDPIIKSFESAQDGNKIENSLFNNVRFDDDEQSGLKVKMGD